MPGYLTHAMVLIEAVRWLQTVRTNIDVRTTSRKTKGKGPIALDDRLYALAGRALTFLVETPVPAARSSLPVARIKNGIGDGMSQWALVGSLGPDLPAAGYILAMNHDWAWRQLHNGGTRRAWVDAKSTSLVLKLLELAEEDEKLRPLSSLPRTNTVSYALGHLSHVAADVLLHPAVHSLADAGQLDPLKHRLFEVAVDARVAHGYFGRSDLYDDVQSWEDYYLDKGDFKEPLTLLMGQVSNAFKGTYGDLTPNQAVCGLSNPTECLAPKFDAPFLMDSYRNTVNWALDEGYDHGPETFDFFWTLSVLIAAAGSAWFLAGGTNSVSTISNTIFKINQTAVTNASNAARTQWENEGFSVHVVRDVVDESLSWPDYVCIPFEWLMGGGLALKLLTFWQVPDGIFGQGTAEGSQKPTVRRVTEVAFPLKSFGLWLLKEITPEFASEEWWQWVWFVVDEAIDVLEYKFLTNESRPQNLEAERLADALWVPKKITAAFLLVGNLVAMIWKSQRTANGVRESGVAPLDFFPPLACGVAVCAIFIFPGTFRNYLLRTITGSHWPSKDTSTVDAFLPVEDVGGRRAFKAASAQKFKVRLFADDPSVIKEEAGRKFFPEGSASASDVDAQPKSDGDARRNALKDWPDQEYALPDLFDHAARFAGLLAMSAVAYNDAAPPVRAHLTSIFKDWNLDFASVTQWSELMSPGGASDLGILAAAEQYTKDLASKTDTPDEQALARLHAALGVTEVAGAIDADFERTGQMIELLNYPDARAARLSRPGAILLPNVDIDTPPPSPLPSPLPLRTSDIDALRDDSINPAGNDSSELTSMRVTKPATAGSPHTLVLRLHADDANRIRVFEKNPLTPKETWPVVLGFTGGGAKLEYELPAGPPEVQDFVVELKGFAGDPGLPAPTGPSPLAPAPFAPGGVVPGAPVFPERRPGEVWIEVIHKEAAAVVAGIRDVALFTAAPFMHVSNMRPTERFYVLYNRDRFTGTTRTAVGNHPFVADIVRALRSDPVLAPNVTMAPLTPSPDGRLDEFVAHEPVRAGDPGEAKLLYIVEGNKYGRDPWLQDEFEIGYAHAPHAHMPVVLHNPRKRQLAPFVESELPTVDIGLFNGVSTDASSINYGGNLEVSPPVAADVVAQPLEAAGRPIVAQPPAPLGKVLLGEGTPFLFDIDVRFAAELQSRTISAALVTVMDSHDVFITTADPVSVQVADREWMIATDVVVGGRGFHQDLLVRRDAGTLKVHAARLATPEFKKFLEAQRAQPVVTFDTSWLSVGHVDEVMVFVPATGAKDFRLLMASPALALKLLDEAKAIPGSGTPAHPLTNCFRFLFWRTARPGAPTRAASITVDAVLAEQRAFNDDLQIRRLTPIETRLRTTLALDAADIIRIPVLYDHLGATPIGMLGATIIDTTVAAGLRRVTTAAYTPNGVNLQVVGKVALIPKPHGPRMRADDVAIVLDKVGVSGVSAADLASLVGTEEWTIRGDTAAGLGTAFSVPAATIRGHPRNAGMFSGAGAVIRNHERIFIPEDRVDLFEAYMFIQLQRIGLTAHFIEDWYNYHLGDGEVHCGTNALHKAPEVELGYAGAQWWDTKPVRE